METKHKECKMRRTERMLRVKPAMHEGPGPEHGNRPLWRRGSSGLTSTDNKQSLEEKQMKQMKVLSEVLPIDLCEKVCSILDLEPPPRAPTPTDDMGARTARTASVARGVVKQPLLSRRHTLFIRRHLDSDTDVECDSRDGEVPDTNVHRQFLKKPEREQVTWTTRYLQPERDEEKTLIKRADDVTDRIVREFCDYMKQLGGDQQSQLFTPKAIKELFQIEFDTHVARSLKVVPKEMPTVEETIAHVTGDPQKSRFAALGREISKDLKVERRPHHLQAFSRSLPPREQWHAPTNRTAGMWRSARHVPADLVTLETVWEGITNLRSVKEYCRWMIEHPEHRRAPYLESLGMFDAGFLAARLTFDIRQNRCPPALSPADVPAPIQHLRKRLSLLAEIPPESR